MNLDFAAGPSAVVVVTREKYKGFIRNVNRLGRLMVLILGLGFTGIKEGQCCEATGHTVNSKYSAIHH